MKVFSLKFNVFVFIVLIFIDCGLSGYIGIWREGYWNALSNKDIHGWIIKIIEFTTVALISCLISGYSQYLGSIIGLHWRTKLTKKALTTKLLSNNEGYSQRIQEDCAKYPQLAINLFNGLIRSIIMIFVFSIIIVHQVNYSYLFFAIIYATIGTLIAGKIALPLINLNYTNQVIEAKFRGLLHMNDLRYIKSKYNEVHRNNFIIYKRTKYLQYFQSFFNQITIIIPHLALSGLYFSSRITFGIFMQVASSLAEVINNLSFILNSFSDINWFLSCRKRLKELELI